MSCHYCTDPYSEKVCEICFNTMIYKTDAKKQYGLSDDQIELLFTISHTSSYRRSTICNKYHPNDLYDLLLDIISTCDNEKEKNKLINKKNGIDQTLKNANKLVEYKLAVKEMLNDCFKKLNYEHIHLYNDKIKSLIDTHVIIQTITKSASDIAIQIYSVIEQCIKVDKIKNDCLIEQEKRVKLADIYVHSNLIRQEYYSDIKWLKCYNLYINSHITYDTFKTQITEYVINEDRKKIKRDILSTTLSQIYSVTYYKECCRSKIFNDYVKSGTLDDMCKVIKDLKKYIENLKELHCRERFANSKIKSLNIEKECVHYFNDTINQFTSFKLDKIKFVEILNNISAKIDNVKTICNIYKINETRSHFLEMFNNYIKLNNITFSELNTQTLLKNEKITSIDTLLDNMGFETCEYTHLNTYIDFIKNGDICNIEKVFLQITNKINIVQHNKNNTDFDNFNKNNPPGSAQLDMTFKHHTCEVLFAFHKSKDTELVIHDIIESSLFFIKIKCKQLNLKHTLSSNMMYVTK